ncbi:hypothetical protein P170DRAFT_442837 [Aspergillus steynii IBT 23096]|uniref:Rhodopsin domain-containing protein n=1 Tax=Aspergillus steynii IBT 23096 TaxID=1392250 RepID=A0A2I2GPN8_9EURO|nr:uncharacterized protein P170DRAFT_442837 [Aspergillus steynii IBT 23096]PLB54841.1 hypothetical protein P170DRAFT_442837 [Aspergillus steynii IBT 23096]
MSSDVAIPSGYSAPFQVVDDAHHGAWVIIATAFGLVIALVSFLIRVYVRVALNPPFAVDDAVLLGATIVTIIQSTLLFVAVDKGFGTAIDLLSDRDVDTAQILITTSDILYLVAIYICKACVVGIHLRLTPQKRQARFAWATLALCTAWVVTAVLVIAVNCELNRPWKGTGAQCVDLLPRWQFIITIDILTELLLFSLAVTLLSGLFMPLKRKMAIGCAFLFRLPLILPCTLHLITLTQNLHSGDATLASVPPVIWAQVELDYSLVACSVFCLRPFMAAVSTNYGTAGDGNLESQSHSHSHRGKGKGLSSGYASRGLPGEGGLIRWFSRVGRSGTEEGIELTDETQGHDGDGKMVIRKDVQYSVEFKKNSRSEDDGVLPDMEYWDRYLDPRP